MKTTYASLMQSKYFNPAFNSAIFDGPIRIYFAQFHESLALKVYFCIQQKLKSEMAEFKEKQRRMGSNILIMIYPTEEIFKMSFEVTQKITQETWIYDHVIGVCGALEDQEIEMLILKVQDIIIKTNQKLPSEEGQFEDIQLEERQEPEAFL